MMVLRIGHRGAAGYEPENTLRSFTKAIDLEVDMVELDVHLCKSWELVVIHDNTVDRTTDGSGRVSCMTIDELKMLDAGLGEQIPTLDEVLDLVDGRVGVNIELKSEGTARPVHEAMKNVVEGTGCNKSHFLVSSFLLPELMEFRKLTSEARIGVLTAGNPYDVLEFADTIKAYSINPNFQMVNKKFISEAHDNGLKILVWTVNKRADIERMEGLEVDGIISDYPDRI